MTCLKSADGRNTTAVDPMFEVRRRWPAEAFDPSADRVTGVAQTHEDMMAIGRLRYDLFIVRDGKTYDYADHAARSFIEPIDYLSLNFWAHNGSHCLAAVRLTWAADAYGAAHLDNLLEHAELNADELHTAVLNSRMVIHDSLRARMRVPQLMRLTYRAGLLSGARRCLIAARPSLSPLYARFGFLPRARTYKDDIAGTMSVMMLDLFDRDQLVRVASPLLKVHDEIVQFSSETRTDRVYA